MPVYLFACGICGATEDFEASMNTDLPQHIRCSCGMMMRRRYTAPSVHRFTEHFNTSLGVPLGSKGQFKTALYEAQEKMTERLGFQQVYSEAPPATGRTEEGMDVTHDTRKTLGMST